VVKAFGQFGRGFSDKTKEYGMGGCTDIACYRHCFIRA